MYAVISSTKHASPREISLTFPGLLEIFTLMVGEILDMFPSSNELGARMGFLNQSAFTGGRKYLDSMVQISCICALMGTNVFSGRKTNNGAWRPKDSWVPSWLL